MSCNSTQFSPCLPGVVSVPQDYPTSDASQVPGYHFQPTDNIFWGSHNLSSGSITHQNILQNSGNTLLTFIIKHFYYKGYYRGYSFYNINEQADEGVCMTRSRRGWSTGASFPWSWGRPPSQHAAKFTNPEVL